MVESAEDRQRMLASLASTSLTRLPALADELVDQLWDDVYTPGGPVGQDDLWRSCRDNIGSILTSLHGSGPTPADLMQASRTTGARRAHQRCPLQWVLHAWRVGGQIMWNDLAERAGTDNPAQLRELVSSAGEFWSVTESFSTEMALSYQSMEQELQGGVDLRLSTVLDALLDGRAAEVRAEAEHVLNLSRNTRFVMVVAETSGDRPVSPQRLTSALGEKGISSVWRLRTGCQVGLVLVDDATPPTIAAILRAQAVARIGVSPILTELIEVCAGHRMAMLAMTTLPPRGHGAAALDECWPDALALSSPELAERMVSVTFGPVMALPAAERDELLNTVSIWVRSQGSTLRAAKMLHCHRNTVLNRLRRMESLTHLDLSDVGVWPQLLMALSMLRREGRLPAAEQPPK